MKALTKEHSLTRQMGLLMVGRGVAFILTFSIPLVLVRIFTPESFGLYKQLFLIHSTLVTILTLGFSASLFYFLPRHPQERQAYVSQTLFVLSISGTFGGMVLVAFKAQVAQALNNPALETYIPYLAVFTVLSLITEMLENLMVTFKQAALAALTSFGSELLKGAMMIGAAVLTRSMVVLVIAAVVWSTCRFVTLLVYLRKLDLPLWAPLVPPRLAEQFRYAMPFGLAVLVRAVADGLPQYAVSYLYDPVMFAIYSVGYLQIPAVSIASDSIAEVTLVRLTELRNGGMLEEALCVLGESVIKLCLFLFPLFTWLMISSKDLIIVLFTERFATSVDIFRVFLATIPLIALGLDYVPRAFADTGFVLRVNVLRVVLTAMLLMILIPPLGLIGAALATVIAIGITKVLILIRVERLFNTSVKRVLPWTRLAKIVAACAAAGLVAWAIQAASDLDVRLRPVLTAATFTFCYGALVWNADVMEPNDKRRMVGYFEGLSKFNLEWLLLGFRRLF